MEEEKILTPNQVQQLLGCRKLSTVMRGTSLSYTTIFHFANGRGGLAKVSTLKALSKWLIAEVEKESKIIGLINYE